MKKLEFQDIIPLQEYEKIRESFRQSVIEQKKRRHVQVGPYVSLAFENRDTVLFQVQEMIRAERLQDPAKIQEEIDVYNDLIPGARELSATLFIEITEEGKIQEILNRLIGIDKENMVYFQIGKKKRIPAIFEAGRSKEEKISAVHFVRFKWDFTQIETFRSGNENFLVIDHPNYREQTAISEALKKELLEDLDQSDE
ncbi:MAG TPA: DUF3501 family protein [Candidatus Manganitrophaceae bacterium]|nr:DUF3501 family protein [Candidatus Manganitrophaceae bacterium]